MANKINYQVGFTVQKQGLNQIKSALKELSNMKFGDLMKINDSDMRTASDALRDIKEEAFRVEAALNKAFNTKLNTVNVSTFNQQLKGAGSSIEQVYSTFSKAGAAGENAFRTLTNQVLNTNVQLKESHTLLDNMATTLANTVKWNVASSAVNSLSGSIERAFGYVKALDTSLNDIRIVTNKNAEDMQVFAEKANQAAQSLGKTATDYTEAALIYAQQGFGPKIFKAKFIFATKA